MMGEWWVPYAAGLAAWGALCLRYEWARKVTVAVLWKLPHWIAKEISESHAYRVEDKGRRFFSAADKVEIRRRAGNQCEWHTDGDPSTWRRCWVIGDPREQVQHDHVFPKARGGLTTLDNAALLCVTHNRRKSATIPTDLELAWLAASRATYFDVRIPDPRLAYV